jgi:hypothetical protein
VRSLGRRQGTTALSLALALFGYVGIELISCLCCPPLVPG